MNGRIINNPSDADATVLLAENEQELLHLVDQVNWSSAECGLYTNIKKANTMIIVNGNGRATMNNRLSREILNQVTVFSYLWHLTTADM